MDIWASVDAAAVGVEHSRDGEDEQKFKTIEHIICAYVTTQLGLLASLWHLTFVLHDSLPGHVQFSCTVRAFHPSNLLLNSLSFCSTSNSNLSTPYRSASFLCFTALARSLSSPPRALPPPILRFLPALPSSGSSFESRPCCSSARAFRVSMRRSWRSVCASARERRSAM